MLRHCKNFLSPKALKILNCSLPQCHQWSVKQIWSSAYSGVITDLCRKHSFNPHQNNQGQKGPSCFRRLNALECQRKKLKNT